MFRPIAAATSAAVLLCACASEPSPQKVSYAPLFVEAQAEPVPDVASPTPQEVEPSVQVSDPVVAEVWEPVQVEQAAEQPGDALLALAQGSNDVQARLQYLDQAAAAGSGEAHYELAKVYTLGKDRPRDLASAQEHLQAAAGNGNAEAERVLGWQMIKGQEMAKNVNGGTALMEAAAQSSVRAQRELGSLYANLYNDYRLDNTRRGEYLLRQAYGAGDPEAAAALGKYLVREGRPLEAVEPLQFAGSQGDALAAKLLSTIAEGSQAANQPSGDSGAGEHFYQLANALMLKTHGEAEEARAYALYSLAADYGYNMANAELRAISGVNTLMTERRGAGWLEATKQEILAGQ